MASLANSDTSRAGGRPGGCLGCPAGKGAMRFFSSQRRIDGISASYTTIARVDFAAQARFYRRVLLIILIVAMLALYSRLGFPWWCAFIPAVCLAYDRQHKTTAAGKPPAGEMAADAVVASTLIAVHPIFMVPALLVMLTLTAIAAVGYGPRQSWIYAGPTVVLAPVAAAVSHPPYSTAAIITFAICAAFFAIVVAAIVRWDQASQLKLAQFAEVVERLPVAVVVAEWVPRIGRADELRVMTANLAAATLAGTRTGDLVGVAVDRVFAPVVGTDTIEDIYRALNSLRAIDIEAVQEPSSGASEPKSFTVRAAPLEGRVVSISFEDITPAILLRDELRRAATHDALTGLPNRLAFGQRLDAALDSAASSGGSVAVLALDLDGFKEINDTWGHHQGDRCLVAFGDRISAALDDQGVLARLGGDEFVVLLTGGAADDCAIIVEQLRRCLEAPLALDGVEMRAYASIGAATYPAEAADADTLMQLADAAMYAEKKFEGRDRRGEGPPA